MRIIAGSLKGHSFESKSNTTHPMSEKMRGAIFNVLGDVNNLDFLDIYAGSGAISFEAISRGARSSTAIESNKNAQKDIELNITKLKLNKLVKLVKANFITWLDGQTLKYDVIIADPPYDKLQLNKLINICDVMTAGAIFVLSIPPETTPPLIKGLELKKDKDFGDSKLVFYINTL